MGWSGDYLRRGARIGLACTLLVCALAVPSAAAAGGRVAPGAVLAWGSNASGQLGDGTTTDAATPTAVLGVGGQGTLENATAVAAGGSNSYAVLSDGTVAAWGAGEDGALGDGATTSSAAPLLVSGLGGAGSLSGVTSVSGGEFDGLALTSGGTVDTWGSGGDGQLGDNGTADSAVPLQVDGAGAIGTLSGVVAIAAGGFYDTALLGGGTVEDWGSNTYGQLGNGGSANSSTPVDVQGVGGAGTLTGVSAIATGVFHSVALLSDGTVDTWGQSHIGQLGNGSTSQSGTPVAVEGVGGVGTLQDVVAVAAGGYHSLALLANGTLVSWGTDANGELGDDDAAAQTSCGCATTPVVVQGISDVVAIAASRRSA
jgi:alpha-tubulin suppressor-like RCC1 family protein